MKSDQEGFEITKITTIYTEQANAQQKCKESRLKDTKNKWKKNTQNAGVITYKIKTKKEIWP